jgi:hypothetical protein
MLKDVDRELALTFLLLQTMYCVVEFRLDRSVAVVAKAWLSEDETMCKWPPYSSISMVKAIQRQEVPKDSWESYACRILYSTRKSEDSYNLPTLAMIMI